MSNVFGELRQIAYVTDDMDRTLAFLQETAGIGPFFVARNIAIGGSRFRGTPIDLTIDAAIGNAGAMQIEVIRQTSPGASMYTEFTDKHGFGLVPQHYSAWPDKIEPAVERALAHGYEIVQEGRSGHGPFYYFQHPDQPDFTFEVTELNPPRRSIFDQVRAAAETWDGADPIREGWPKPII